MIGVALPLKRSSPLVGHCGQQPSVNGSHYQARNMDAADLKGTVSEVLCLCYGDSRPLGVKSKFLCGIPFQTCVTPIGVDRRGLRRGCVIAD